MNTKRAGKGALFPGAANALTFALAQKLTSLVPDRINLKFSHFRNSVGAVDDIFSDRGCSIYNISILSQEDLETYIDAQPNLYLVRDDIKLSAHTHGAVIKDKIVRSNGDVGYCYILIVASNLKNRIMRILTLAHELGHVFLHGRLLQPGMLLKRRHMTWHSSDCILRHQMEAEANIFALLTLIPSALISELRRSSGEIPENRLVRKLTYVLSCLYGESIHSQLIRERLLIEDVLNFSSGASPANGNRDSNSLERAHAEFDRLLEGPVWILNSRLEDDLVAWQVPPLTTADLGHVFRSLQRTGTISVEQARAARQYARRSDPRRQHQSGFRMVVVDN